MVEFYHVLLANVNNSRLKKWCSCFYHYF